MQLRNNGIVTKSDYVGKKLKEAESYAKKGGFNTRIVEVDGTAKMLDNEPMSNRINFRVLHGYVTDAFTG